MLTRERYRAMATLVALQCLHLSSLSSQCLLTHAESKELKAMEEQVDSVWKKRMTDGDPIEASLQRDKVLLLVSEILLTHTYKLSIRAPLHPVLEEQSWSGARDASALRRGL